MNLRSKRASSNYRTSQGRNKTKKNKFVSFLRLIIFLLSIGLFYYGYNFSRDKNNIKKLQELAQGKAVKLQDFTFQSKQKTKNVASPIIERVPINGNSQQIYSKTTSKIISERKVIAPSRKKELKGESTKKVKEKAKEKKLEKKIFLEIERKKREKSQEKGVLSQKEQSSEFQQKKSYLTLSYQNSVEAFNFALQEISKLGFQLEKISLNDYENTGTTILEARNQAGNRLVVSYREGFSKREQKKKTLWQFRTYLN